MSPLRRTAKRWSLVLVGAGLLLLALGGALASGNELFLQVQTLAVLGVAPVAIALVGLALVRRQFPPRATAVVAAWTAGAVLGSGVLGVGAIALLVGGLPLGTAIGAATYLGTVGSLAGVVLGYNDARRREEARTAHSAWTAVEQSTDAVAIVEPDDTYSLVNDAFVDLNGYDAASELVGENWRRPYDDETIAEMETDVLPTLARAGTWRGETTVRRQSDEERITQELSLTSLESGQTVVIARDVTEREERRREIDRLALEGTGTGIWEWTIETGAVNWNESFERLVGLEPGTFEGTYDAFAERIHPDDLANVESAVERALEDDVPYQAEFRMERSDGATIWVEGRGHVVGEGEDRRMLGIVTDVTDRMERETALEEAQSRLQLALGGASPAIWEWNLETDEIVWNESMAEQLAFSPGEFGGNIESFVELVHPEDRADLQDAMAAVTTGDSVAATKQRVADADGEYHWLDLRGKRVTDDDGVSRVVGLARDVTEREAYRRELEERRQAIETLHDSTREMIEAPDVDAVYAAAVEAARNALDAPLVTLWLADDSGEQLVPATSSDAARAQFESLPTYTAAEQSTSWDVFESGDVHVSTDTSSEPGAANPETQIRHEIVLPVGTHGVMNVGTTEDDPFDDVDVDVARLLASNLVAAIDRAEREDELRRQTDQLEFFNSILRHDVLNGMTVIQSRAELLADDLEGRQREYAATIEKWSENVTDVTGRVQRVIETLTSAEDATALEPIDASELLAEHLDRLETTSTDVTFEAELPETAYVAADELLSDVLGNVLTNAIEHNDEADLTVRTSVDVSDDRVTIQVADDGSGVPDDRKESIFRRGETGHAKETGSGFGLFFVDAMITKYGGDVRVTDNDDSGATFVVELPRATPPEPTDAESVGARSRSPDPR